MSKLMMMVCVAAGMSCAIGTAMAEAALAPGRIDAPDLTPLKAPNAGKGEPIVWIEGGEAKLPIVCGTDSASCNAAEWLASSVELMTGVKPKVIPQRHNTRKPEGAAIWMSATRRGWRSESKFAAAAIAAAGLEEPDRNKGRFRVVTKDGSVFLLGDGVYAAYDFGERVLGIRQYFQTKEGGRSVLRTKGLAIPALDYADEPVFARRELWPYDSAEWCAVWKGGNTHPAVLHVHTPGNWHTDTNFNYKVTKPEVLERTADGQRGVIAELCYGNPATIDEYLRRMDIQLKGGPSAGGYVDAANKSITVSQDDVGVNCQCDFCKKLRRKELGPTGDSSPIIWGYFTEELSKRVKKLYPDWRVVTLPYINTCDLPSPGFRYTEDNVEAMLCTMPGLAMLKNKEAQEHEENLILAWQKATGNPVQNWHYICWPAEFTCAPYVFGEVIKGHYQRMKGHIVGTFINGGYPLERLIVSAYVWVRCLWNPDLDLKAVYDVFCERMFGAAAKPMRTIVQMQEDGWNRQWGSSEVSNKNIYEISYPRKDVLRMQALFAEAKRLAAGDETVLKRIAYYESGFTRFFAESEQNASGTAFQPTPIQKVAGLPKVDGVLDDEQWEKVKGTGFVHAWKRWKSDPAEAGGKPIYPTELKMVWTPGAGVTIGVKCFDPFAKTLVDSYPPNTSNETLEFFFDCSGNGNGNYYQLIVDIRNQPQAYVGRGMKVWSLDGVRTAVARQADGWSCEVFIPFEGLKDFPGLQLPEGTAAAGRFWSGNVCRYRAVRPGEKDGDVKNPNGIGSFSRLYTRGSDWNKDSAAFGKLQFKE